MVYAKKVSPTGNVSLTINNKTVSSTNGIPNLYMYDIMDALGFQGTDKCSGQLLDEAIISYGNYQKLFAFATLPSPTDAGYLEAVIGRIQRVLNWREECRALAHEQTIEVLTKAEAIKKIADTTVVKYLGQDGDYHTIA